MYIKFITEYFPEDAKDDWQFLEHPHLVAQVNDDIPEGPISLSAPGRAPIKIPVHAYVTADTVSELTDNPYEYYFLTTRDNIDLRKFSYTGRYSIQLYVGFSSDSLVDIKLKCDGLPLKGLKYHADHIPNSEGFLWSNARLKNFSFAEYLCEQIRARYGFFERPLSGKSNIVVDSFFPRLLYATKCALVGIQARADLPKTSVAISEFVANTLGVPKIEIDDLCKVLGYTPKAINTLLRQVKAKNLNMIYAGAGGTGINTAYWLRELCKMTRTINLFRSVHVYEKETAEFSNILRFPVDTRTVTGQMSYPASHKLNLMYELVKTQSRNQVRLSDRYIRHVYDLDYTLISARKMKPGSFIYGAPGIEYRNQLSDLGNFICATHASTTCSVWLNPRQTLDLEVESYGMIQLGGFFMNQLRMTIGLLELLASDQDLSEQDKHIFDYEFDGTIVGRPKRQYAWQIDPDLLMMTEDEATNI